MLCDVLQASNNLVRVTPCCKTDQGLCDCLRELSTDYTKRADSYNCHKKMGTYVLKYGPVYSSEIYWYLDATNFIERMPRGRPLRVFSLGCGFSPDYFAIKQYVADKSTGSSIEYVGIDLSNYWGAFRPLARDCSYISHDLTRPFELVSPDIVVVGKVFSTLFRNNRAAADAFLLNLQVSVLRDFNEETILVFFDVNHKDFGRDYFHQAASRFLSRCRQSYFEGGYTGNGWTCIKPGGMVFYIPPNLCVAPETNPKKSVVFEYRR